MAAGDDYELVVIGRITKPRGIKGYLKIITTMDVQKLLANSTSVLVGRERDRAALMEIEEYREGGAYGIIKFSDIDDRTSAEKMTGSDMFLRRRDLPPLPDNSFYPYELMGVEVTDESGASLGTVIGIERYPAQDVLVIAFGDTAVMAPAAREFFVALDRDAGRLVLRLPEGLPEIPLENM